MRKRGRRAKKEFFEGRERRGQEGHPAGFFFRRSIAKQLQSCDRRTRLTLRSAKIVFTAPGMRNSGKTLHTRTAVQKKAHSGVLGRLNYCHKMAVVLR